MTARGIQGARLVGQFAAVPLLVVLALAGCSGPDSVADRSYAGLPESVDETDVGASGEPVATWIEDDETFAVTMWGSSSCPAVPSSIDTTDSGAVEITFVTDSSGPCTADLAPTTHEFGVPDDAAASPLEVTIGWEGADTTSTLTLD